MISDCFQHSTVLPFRFGTVFNDDESLRKSASGQISVGFKATSISCAAKTEMHLEDHFMKSTIAVDARLKNI